jgi:subtilisin family serine protease
MRAVQNCAAAGADVINMSLGGGRPSRTEENTYNQVAAQNILVVASAGNDGTTTVNYPAGYAAVMSVAAVDPTMTVADFSQRNADVEIAAPGVAVLSSVPANSQLGGAVAVGGTEYSAVPMDGSPMASATGNLADFGLGDTVIRGAMAGQVCLIQRGVVAFADKVTNCQRSGGIAAVIYNNVVGEDLYGTLGGARTSIPSVGITQANGESLLASGIGQSTTVTVGYSDTQYEYYSGTSMAAPHVAGVAALVWSQHPTCTADQIRSSLNNSALDLGTAGRDDLYGYGLAQAKAASDRITNQGCGN